MWFVLHAKGIGDYTLMRFFSCRDRQRRELLHLRICSRSSLGAKLWFPYTLRLLRVALWGGLWVTFFFFFFSQRLVKQPILTPLTPAKEILYELESVRKDLMRLSWTVTSQKKILNPQAAVLCNWGQVKECEGLKKLSTYLKRQSHGGFLMFNIHFS